MPEATRGGASLPNTVSELFELVKVYARQETVGPLRGAGRSFAFGIGGSIVLSIGLVLLALAALRALQTETGSAFDGNWSFAPYLLTLVVVATAIAVTLFIALRRADGDGGRAR